MCCFKTQVELKGQGFMVKMLIPMEESCHNEYTCVNIWDNLDLKEFLHVCKDRRATVLQLIKWEKRRLSEHDVQRAVINKQDTAQGTIFI